VRSPLLRGPQTGTLERRYLYADFPRPGGVNTQSNPAQVKPWQFTALENIRWDPDGVRPRGGQKKMNIGGVIHDDTAAIHPAQFITATPNRDWIVGDGCPGESVGIGFYLGHFDPDQEPQIQRAAWYSTATGGIAFATYGGVPHVVVNTQLRRLNLVDVDWGTENIALAGESQDVPLATLPGTVPAMFEAFGVLYILCSDGSIQSWDGKTLRQDMAPVGAAVPVALRTFRDTIVVGYAAAAAKLSWRAPGPSPGTWTHVAVPGIATKAGLNSIISYKDNAYGASGGANVWKWDGAVATPAFKTFAGAQVESVAEAFGYLFVGYGAAGAKIARYDNAVWFDPHKNLTLQVEMQFAHRVPGLNYYKDQLTAAVMRTGQSSVIAVSPGSDTAGLYQVLGQYGLAPNEIRYLLQAT
jgi:hypothetical protein